MKFLDPKALNEQDTSIELDVTVDAGRTKLRPDEVDPINVRRPGSATTDD